MDQEEHKRGIADMEFETKEVIIGLVFIIFGVLLFIFPALLAYLVGAAFIITGLAEFIPRSKKK